MPDPLNELSKMEVEIQKQSMALYRSLLGSVSETDMALVMESMVELASNGNVTAARALFSLLWGKSGHYAWLEKFMARQIEKEEEQNALVAKMTDRDRANRMGEIRKHFEIKLSPDEYEHCFGVPHPSKQLPQPGGSADSES